MSLSATIPVSQMDAANAALEEMGFGPSNFSVPVYTGPQPSFATFHAWDDPAFTAAVISLQGTVDLDSGTVGPFDIETSQAAGTPQERVEDALTAVSGDWGGSAQELTGTVTPGLYGDSEGVLWWVIQTYDTGIWSDPTAVPALVRRARVPGEVAPWVQPLDQFDAYKLTNPFTGEGDKATHNGQTWQVSQADGAGNNVWAPGAFGWVVI